MTDFEKRISQIAGEDGWFKGGDDEFIKLGKELISRGFSEDEAVQFLSTCYHTVASEYGD